jgi:hypothetical protein
MLGEEEGILAGSAVEFENMTSGCEGGKRLIAHYVALRPSDAREGKDGVVLGGE